MLLTFLAGVILGALSGGRVEGRFFLVLFLFQFGTMGVLFGGLLLAPLRRLRLPSTGPHRNSQPVEGTAD